MTLPPCYSSPRLTGDWCSVPEHDKLSPYLPISGCQPHQERGPDVPLEILPDEGRGALTAHGDQRHVVQGAGEEPPVAAGEYSKADYSNSH